MLIAVFPHRHARGLEVPGYRGHTYDWRERGDGNTRRIQAAAQVTSLVDALSAQYATDAHLVAYVLREQGAPLLRQPKVNKSALAWVREQGYELTCDTFFADVDNPGHAPWTPAELEQVREHLERVLPPTCGYYLTSRGYRVVQPLALSLPVELFEAALRAWLLELAALGIAVDFDCGQWTRSYRLPHVVRDGRRYSSPVIELARMRPIEPPRAAATRAQRPAREVRPVECAATVPDMHLALVESLVLPLSQVPQGERHRVGLALAAALCRRTAPEHVPAIVEAAGEAAGWDAEHHRKSAEDTVSRWMARMPTSSRDLSPELADLLDERVVRADPPPAPMPLEEATAIVEEALRHPPDGVSLIRAACGLGKTRAARRIAQERAARPERLGVRTSIAVPTNELAEQVARDLAPLPVLRVFGPGSMLRADGGHECRFLDEARSLASGKQSVRLELCQGHGKDPCLYADGCRAKDGLDGDAGAKVVVGPHALLAELDAAAGKTGLLVIDEPAEYLIDEVIRHEELEAAMGALRLFEHRYASAMAAALKAVWWWTKLTGEPGEPVHLSKALEGGVDPALELDGYEATGEEDALSQARAALPPTYRGSAPPLSDDTRRVLRRVRHVAIAAGAASRVLHAVHRALVSAEGRATARIEGEGRALVVTYPDEQLEQALRREGSVVVAAADAHVCRPVVERIVGYEPPMVEASAADGAPIHRVWVRTSSATRTAWWHHGRLRKDVVGRQVKRVLALLEASGAQKVAFVTYKAAEGELAGLVAPHVVGHYGGLRGLDRWKDFDALVTMGDPWPNLGAVEHELNFVGLGGDRTTRAEARARAELEQAHGRLRTVHRQRPGLAVHVGGLLPGGWHPDRVEVHRMAEGRPANVEGGLDVEQLVEAVRVLGGPSCAARALQCSRAALHRYVTGARAPPPNVVQGVLLVLKSAQKCLRNPSSRDLTRGFGDMATGVSGTYDTHTHQKGPTP